MSLNEIVKKLKICGAMKRNGITQGPYHRPHPKVHVVVQLNSNIPRSRGRNIGFVSLNVPAVAFAVFQMIS